MGKSELPRGGSSILICLLAGTPIRKSVDGEWRCHGARAAIDPELIDTLAERGFVRIVNEGADLCCIATDRGGNLIYRLIRHAQATPIDAVLKPAHRKPPMG